MNLLDRAISLLAPIYGLRRAQARRALSYYEAAQPSRMRKLARDKRSGDMQIWKAAPILRDQARNLEQNYDIARGILNTLVNNIVGPNGITVEPLPRTKTGEIHQEFAQTLLNLRKEWVKAPEVTRTMSWAMSEQMMCRTWLRDGECFIQALEGLVQKLAHATDVPLSLELIEPDLCPFEYFDPALNIWQGIQRNGWGQPTNYFLYKNYPGDKFYFPSLNQVKSVSADRMLHLMLRDRISQLRGVSQFASIITRLDDIKDYEESERVAAKVAASMAAVIKKGDPASYVPQVTDSTGQTTNSTRRQLKFTPGMIFDDLLPGEDVSTIDSKRPNINLETFRSGQLRAAAAGVGAGYSSISKNYNGTYSAQRQELVEQFGAYQTMTGQFVSRISEPVWSRFTALVIGLRLVPIPKDLDISTVADAFFAGPPMPWINPLDEALANRTLVRAGFKSASQVIRGTGSNRHDVYASLAQERAEAKNLNLTLECDAASAAASSARVGTQPSGTDNAHPQNLPATPEGEQEDAQTIQ